MAAARKSSRYGHRDATMILIGYRHGLRASELCDLQWSQVELATGRLHVRRAKNGSPSVHPMQGDEDGEVANLGRVTTILGSNASVGSLLSNAEVTLGAGAVVNGSLTTGGKLVVPSSAVLKGKVTTNAPIHAVQPALATVKLRYAPCDACSANRGASSSRYIRTCCEAHSVTASDSLG